MEERMKNNNEKELLLGLEELCRNVRDLQSDAMWLGFMRGEVSNVLDELTRVRKEKEEKKQERKYAGR